MRSRALNIKNEYVGRGPVSIQSDLEDELPTGSKIPSISSLTRLFRGLSSVQKYEPNRSFPCAKKQQGGGVHDLWQMDDKGAEIYPGLGYVGILNVKDVFSRVHSGCLCIPYAHSRSHPSTKHYVEMLRKAFGQVGLPVAIQTDRGTLFWESNIKSPFPTPLHLWLIGLGVEFQHARSFRPTDQAIVERTHQTIHKQLKRRTEYNSIEALNDLAQIRMDKLNKKIPCSTIGKPPLAQYPHAQHSGRNFCPAREAEHFDVQRVKSLLSNMEWFRRASSVKTFSLGRKIYYHKNLPTQAQIRITFDPITLNLNCYNDKELLACLPIKGISYAELTAGF